MGASGWGRTRMETSRVTFRCLQSNLVQLPPTLVSGHLCREGWMILMGRMGGLGAGGRGLGAAVVQWRAVVNSGGWTVSIGGARAQSSSGGSDFSEGLGRRWRRVNGQRRGTLDEAVDEVLGQFDLLDRRELGLGQKEPAHWLPSQHQYFTHEQEEQRFATPDPVLASRLEEREPAMETRMSIVTRRGCFSEHELYGPRESVDHPGEADEAALAEVGVGEGVVHGRVAVQVPNASTSNRLLMTVWGFGAKGTVSLPGLVPEECAAREVADDEALPRRQPRLHHPTPQPLRRPDFN